MDRMKVWGNKVLAENNKVLKYKACFFALDLNRFKGVLGRIPDWLPSIFAEEVQSSDEGAYYCAGKKAHDRLADIISKEGHVIAVKTRGGEITVRYKVGILPKQDKQTK